MKDILVTSVRQQISRDQVQDVHAAVRKGLQALPLAQAVQPVEPRIDTIAVLDLTDKSHGNAIGVGYADLISQRLRDKIDVEATVTNCLTARNLSAGKIPISLPTDREVLEAGLGGTPADQARLLLIRNTLELETVWVSEALLPDVDADPALDAVVSRSPCPSTPTAACNGRP